MNKSLIFISLIIGCLFLNTPISAANSSRQWRQDVEAIVQDTTLSDSLKVIHISDLSYSYFYYYRTLDATYIDEYLRLVQPFIQQTDSNDLYAYIYSIALIVAPAESKQSIQDKCIHHTQKSHNPIIIAQSWDRIGRKNIDEASGLHYLSKAVEAIEGLDHYALESSLYGSIAMYYNFQGDQKNELKYARHAMQLAIRSDDPRRIFGAWEQIAETHVSQNDYPAAIEAYQKAIDIYNKRIQTITEKSPHIRYRDDAYYMVATVNLGSMYYHNGELQKAITLLTKALKTAQQYNIVETQAYCHKEIANILLGTGQYKEAERQLLQTEQLLSGNYVKTAESDHIDYEVKLILGKLYHTTGEYKKSATYYQEGIRKYRHIFDENLLAQNQQWAASYETRKQEQQIQQIQTLLAYHKKQNKLYITILITILLLLFFIFGLYRTRIQLAKHQKQALRNKTRKLEFQKKKAELEKTITQNQADSLKQMEALSNQHTQQRNRALQEVRALFTRHPELKQHQAEINNLMLQQNRIDKNIEEFKEGVSDTPPEFERKLQQIAHNKLTSLDLKYCRLIYLDTPAKELAERLSVEPKTVRMNKYRLKQKLKLNKEDNLNEFIKNIGQH